MKFKWESNLKSKIRGINKKLLFRFESLEFRSSLPFKVDETKWNKSWGKT